MQLFFNNLQDKKGNAISGAYVIVTNYPSGTPATIYSANEAIPANEIGSLQTDDKGKYQFYAPNGRYTIRLVRGAQDLDEIDDIQIADIVDVNEGAITFSFSNVATMVASPFLQVGFFADTKGYYSPGDGGGNDYEIVASGTGVDDGGSYIDLGGSSVQAKGLFTRWHNISQWGASPLQNPTTNLISIQSAWNYGAAEGVKIYGAPGIFEIAASGSQLSGRNYGLLVPSGLTFEGSGIWATVIRAANSTNMDIVTTNRPVPSEDIDLRGFQVDGNYTGQTAGGMNIWLGNAERVVLKDISSVEGRNFGFRLQSLSNLQFDNLYVDNSTIDTGSDAVHFYDCSDVVGSNVFAKSVGDDAFIITAQDFDTSNISISNIVATAPVTGGGGGRGVLINLADTAVAAVTQRKISNIKLSNVVTYDCKGPALLMTHADFENVDIDLIDKGSRTGLSIDGNIGGIVCSMTNCTIDVSSYECGQGAIEMSAIGLGTSLASNNKLTAKIYNPGDSFVAATLRGDDWDIDLNIDYDPNGTKVSPSFGLDCFLTNSRGRAKIKGASTNINFRATSANVKLDNIALSDAVGNSITIAPGATNIQLTGGSLGGDPVTNNGTNTRFYAVEGAYSRGSLSISPNGSGQAVIPHGLVGNPNWSQATLNGFSQVVPNVLSSDATNLTIQFRDFTGAAVTTGSYTIRWEAALN